MKADLNRLLAEVDGLASLPSIHRELNLALSDPLSSIGRFGEIIENDIDLTARLLRIANSAMYGFPRQIETVPQAVTLLGLEQIRDLVAATLVLEFFKGISSNLVNMESFWRHSIACGTAARILAVYRRELNPERCFVSGLLHDIGRLVIFLKMPGPAGDVFDLARSRDIPMAEAEAQVLGADHAQIGGMLLDRWEFPNSMIGAVRHHHSPLACLDFPADAALIHVADIISLAMELGHSGDQTPPRLESEAWTVLGLPHSTLGAVVTEIDRQFQTTVRMFLP